MSDSPFEVTEKHPTGRRRRRRRLLIAVPVVLGVLPLSFLVLLAAGETSVSGTALSVALAVLLGVVGLSTYLSARLAGMRRRRALLIAFLAAPASFVLTLLILWLLVTLQAGPSADDGNAACLKQRHLPVFTAYNLGRKFAGLPLTSEERSCDAPPPGPIGVGEPASVVWISDAIYGTCDASGGGCGPPLDIQSWPECDRTYSSYGVVEPPGALSPRKSFFLSGSYKIPTAALEYGLSTRLEMYTGQTTIVVFTNGPTLAKRAAHALARAIEPKLSSISAARLRALAVDRRGCQRSELGR